MSSLLRVEDLSVRFRMRGGRHIAAVSEVSFDVAPGECLALVGESGCGKSVLAAALLGLLPGNAQYRGSALLGAADGPRGAGVDSSTPAGAEPAVGAEQGAGKEPGAGTGSGARAATSTARGTEETLDLLAADEHTLATRVRGRRVGLVPQSPAAHLTPVRSVRSQLEETVRELTGTPRRALRAAAETAAERAAFPADHLDRYPHQLSGGLAQRAATALALVGGARLLIADEPTTGLDRELVEHTVDELRRHTDDGRGLLLITHDLAAAERIADRVAVMYAGRVVELTAAGEFFGSPGPRHPYAHGLLEALPERGFTPIPGMPPELGALPGGCAFAPRCGRATDACAEVPGNLGGTACHHPLIEPATAAGRVR